MEPGVGTLTWLGMPPGVENCRTSRGSPARPRDLRVDLAVGAFEVDVGDERRAAVPGPGDVEDLVGLRISRLSWA